MMSNNLGRNPVPNRGPRGARHHYAPRRAAQPAGERASGRGGRGPTRGVQRRCKWKSGGAPSPSAAPRSRAGPGRASKRPGEARRRRRRPCLPGSRNTCCRARAPFPQSMPAAFSGGASPTPAGPAAAGLTHGARGLPRAGGKWREKGLFGGARRAEAPPEPGRRPAGRNYFRFRSQPAAPVKFLNLAPGRGDPRGGASPAGRERVAASPLRGAASGRCSPKAPSDAARRAAALRRGGGRGRMGPPRGGAAGGESPGVRTGSPGSGAPG